MKVSEDFQKPQVIVDAKKSRNQMRNLHDAVDSAQDVVKDLDGDFMLNPTHFATVGKDQDLHVTPEFSDGEVIRELHSMKLSLHALEDKINAAYGRGEEKTQNNLRKEVASIRSKIDELSNKLAPHPIDDRS